MTNIAIKIENLGKSYFVGHSEVRAGHYSTLRDSVTHGVRSLVRQTRDMLSGKPIIQGDRVEEFWALNDVSLEIEQGETIGIIGRNGAGKSTLLKILSRITEPTKGRATLHGRVASLLEVGTGFHPELTGRENIFLNGAILGMSRNEIQRQFDEIVAFAEVEKFLDTPVKRYSSGMYMRLAFSVAAHLETEILIIDEVLSVGDINFQKKCLSRIGDISSGGRTVIFVSHNLNAVEQLCNSVACITEGKLTHYPEVRKGILQYLAFQNIDQTYWRNSSDLYKDEAFTPLTLTIVDFDGRQVTETIRNDDDVWIEITGTISMLDPGLCVGYAIYTEDGELLYWSYHTDGAEETWPTLCQGRVTLTTKMPKRVLNEGKYKIEIIASIHYVRWILSPGHNNPYIYVQIAGGLSDSPYWTERRPGVLGIEAKWDSV